MATEKQTEANRLNAQRSTGPRSAEGKARSRFNALQSGIDAQSILLPGEDPAALETLRDEYYGHHQPVTPDERDTLDAIIHAVCLMRRFRILEAQLVQHELANTPDLDQAAPLGHIFSHASLKFVYLQSRMNSVERSFHRNQDRLDRLKSQRPPLEDAPEAAPAPHPQPQPPPPQPPQIKSLTPKLGSFPDSPTEIPIPPHHPTDPKDCPSCRHLGKISPSCNYLRQFHGQPLPGHPARLVDCPDCRNLGYISPTCHYTLKEPQE
jgi:hypothetical protein